MSAKRVTLASAEFHIPRTQMEGQPLKKGWVLNFTSFHLRLYLQVLILMRFESRGAKMKRFLGPSYSAILGEHLKNLPGWKDARHFLSFQQKWVGWFSWKMFLFSGDVNSILHQFFFVCGDSFPPTDEEMPENHRPVAVVDLHPLEVVVVVVSVVSFFLVKISPWFCGGRWDFHPFWRVA